MKVILNLLLLPLAMVSTVMATTLLWFPELPLHPDFHWVRMAAGGWVALCGSWVATTMMLGLVDRRKD